MMTSSHSPPPPFASLFSQNIPTWVGWGSLIVAIVGGLAWAGITLFSPNELLYSAQVQAMEVQNGSRFGGRVKAILVEEGQLVQASQALIQFDDAELKSKIEEATATLSEATARKALLQSSVSPNDLRVAESNVEQARQKLALLYRDTHKVETSVAQNQVEEASLKIETALKHYQHAEKSYKNGIISDQKLEEARLSVRLAEAAKKAAQRKLEALSESVLPEEIAIAKAKLRSCQAELDKLRQGIKPSELTIADAKIRSAQSNVHGLQATHGESIVKSPITGTVNLIAVTPGQLVSPDAPVVTVLDNQHLWVDVYLPESALPYVHVGQHIQVEAPVLKKQTFQGTITFISTKSEFVPSSGSGSPSNSTETSFRIKVNLNPQPIKPSQGGTRLTPGMTVNLHFPKTTDHEASH